MRNRDKISMYAFITSMLLVIVLLFCSLDASAVGNFNVIEHYNITDYFTDSDFPDFTNPSFLSNRNLTVADNLITNGLNISDSYSNYPYTCENYVWFNDEIVNCNSGSFLAVDGVKTGSRLYFKINDTFTSGSHTLFYFSRVTNSGSVSVWEIDYDTDSRVVEIGGDKYFMWGGYSTLYSLFNSNLPIYKVDDIETTLTSIPTSGNINPNYSGGNEETSANNLYLEDAYFLWTTYNPISDMVVGDVFNENNIFKSFVTFNYELTEYQKNHLNEFTINVKASISYSMKFTLHDDYKNWSGSYTYEIPLSQFSSGSLKFNFLDIFNTTGFTSYFNDNSAGEIDFDNSSFKLTMDAELVDSSGGSSGNYTDVYDFLNNKVRNQSRAITNNNNPYVPSNPDEPIESNAQAPTVQTGDGVVPTGNGVATTGNGSVNVVQNNNNGLINPKPVVDYIKNEMIPTGDAVGFVDNLRDATESNEFISLMSDTFSFVPQTVWNDLAFYFEIFLGILVAGFVLRIILDLL